MSRGACRKILKMTLKCVERSSKCLFQTLKGAFISYNFVFILFKEKKGHKQAVDPKKVHKNLISDPKVSLSTCPYPVFKGVLPSQDISVF